MKNYFIKIGIVCLMVLILGSGCAKIPVQSVTLADALQTEGQRMHQLNISLINALFEAKTEALDKFIKDEYTPQALANFKASLPPGTDFQKDFEEITQAIIPKIQDLRNAKAKVLEDAKNDLITKLNTDYAVFDNAAGSLKDLLASAVKLDAEKKALLDQAKAVTGSKIDFDKLSAVIDQFIHKAGTTSDNAVDITNTINNFFK